MTFRTLLLIGCVLSGPTAVSAQTAAPAGIEAIVHGRLLTVSHGVIEDGTVIIQDGRILAVGGPQTPVPAEARLHDATGMTVYPGLIDAINDDVLKTGSLGVARPINTLPADTPSPASTVASHAQPTDLMLVNRLNGVLNAGAAPGLRGPEPGQMAFVQYAEAPSDLVVEPKLALVMNFTTSGARTGAYPSTAFALVGFFRQQLTATQDYRSGVGLRDRDGRQVPNAQLDALIPYLAGDRPVVAVADTDAQIGTALDLAQEFGLRMIIAGGSQLNGEIDRIARMNVPVLFGSITDTPAMGARYDAALTLPARLRDRGVKFAITTLGRPAAGSRNLPYAAGTAVAYGLTYDQALYAITQAPADIYGLSDRLGSLDVGKMANIVIADGDPFDVITDVKSIFVAGVPILMTSRQTVLRDQYAIKRE